MKERMPYVTEGADGMQWVTRSGTVLALANGTSGTVTTGATSKYVAGKIRRHDRMASTGLYSDAAKGLCRPANPALRLQDQDRDGIQAEVLYGLLSAGRKITDPEAALEFYRIYNDWLADFCNHDRQRFVGLASIPSQTVEVAVAETKRVAKLGLGGLDMRASWDMTPLWDRSWDPLWKAATEVNLAVHFHTIGPRPDAPPAEDLPEVSKLASNATKVAGFQLYMATILAAVINGGALERFPALRIVLGESGIGWIPYVLDRMDYEYENRFKGRLGLKMKPSEYWRRQCRATFQEDRAGAMLLELLGEETAMWGSDYPHTDGVFPDSQEYIDRQFGHLPGATRRKITCENVGKFYGLM